MMKRVSLGLVILTGVGALTAIVFQIISGVQYRIEEDHGLEPGYAPTWIVVGTEVGLWIFAVGVLTLGVAGVVALVQRRQMNRRGARISYARRR